MQFSRLMAVFSRHGAEAESDALGAHRPNCSSYAALLLQSFVVRAERAGGARLGRALLVAVAHEARKPYARVACAHVS